MTKRQTYWVSISWIKVVKHLVTSKGSGKLASSVAQKLFSSLGGAVSGHQRICAAMSDFAFYVARVGEKLNFSKSYPVNSANYVVFCIVREAKSA